MIKLVRTDSDNPDFQQLVRLLDAALAVLDGDDHEWYAQFNKTGNIKHVVVAYDGITPVGCGAIKPFNTDSMEVKRMFTLPDRRNKGIAKEVLSELERWTREAGYEKCVLETGKRQPDAVAVYTRMGYKSIPNYGQYVGMENSVCFEKDLTPALS